MFAIFDIFAYCIIFMFNTFVETLTHIVRTDLIFVSTKYFVGVDRYHEKYINKTLFLPDVLQSGAPFTNMV